MNPGDGALGEGSHSQEDKRRMSPLTRGPPRAESYAGGGGGGGVSAWGDESSRDDGGDDCSAM